MNVNGKEREEENTENVISLFRKTESEMIADDPLRDLLQEVEIDSEIIDVAPIRVSKIVSSEQYPDQSMLILEEQLSDLRKNLRKMKFYLGEIDELIPR